MRIHISGGKLRKPVPELIENEIKIEREDDDLEIREGDVFVKQEEVVLGNNKEVVIVKKEGAVLENPLKNKEKEEAVFVKKEGDDIGHLKCLVCPSCSTRFVHEASFLDHMILQQHQVTSSEQRDGLSNQMINFLLRKEDQLPISCSTPESDSGKTNETEVL